MRIYKAGELITNINGESYYLVGKNLETQKGFIVGRNTMNHNPESIIKVTRNFDLLPIIVKYLLQEQFGTSHLPIEMTNFYKSFIGTEKTNILIDYHELKSKEMTKLVIDSATASAEKGLNRNTFAQLSIANNDETKLHIDIASTIYSMLWEVDKETIVSAIMKISKTYSKGNFYTTKELQTDIIQHTEKILGHKINPIQSEYKVKEIINYLFEIATDIYREHINHKEHAFAKYFAIEESIYSVVFHVWNSGSFADTHASIRETVKDFTKQEINCDNKQFPYLEHYIEKAKARREKCTQQQTKYFWSH